MVTDGNRGIVVFTVLGRVQVMVDGSQNNVMADQSTVPNLDSALVLKVAAGIDKDILTKLDVLSKSELCMVLKYKRINCFPSFM